MAEDKPDGPVDSTQWGGKMRKKMAQCEPWRRSYCLETRAENEPESLRTSDPNILRCPACGFTVKVGADT